MLTRGVGQALRMTWTSILRYAESSRGFTEIKQVTARSIQGCRGSVGFNDWNTFVQRVDIPTLSESWTNSWIWVSSPSTPRKLHVTDCSRKPKYMFSFSTANYSEGLHKRHSIKAAAHGIRCICRYIEHVTSRKRRNRFRSHCEG